MIHDIAWYKKEMLPITNHLRSQESESGVYDTVIRMSGTVP